MKGPGSWLVGACLVFLLICIAGVILYRGSAEPPLKGREALPPALPPPPSAAPTSPGPVSSNPAPAPASPETTAESLHARFAHSAPRAQQEAYLAISLLLQKSGGRAALARIQQIASEKTSSMESELRAAFTVRLLAFVAGEDPSVGPDAVRLAATLAADARLNVWVRVQALAALGGVPSTSSGAASAEDGSDFRIGFRIGEGGAGGPSPASKAYRASLREVAIADPSLRPLLAESLAGDSPEVRRAAAAAMAGLEIHADAAALARASASDEDVEVRRLAARSLTRLGSPEALGIVQTMALQDPNDQVRQAAYRMLPQIPGGEASAAAFLSRALASAPDQDKPSVVAAAFMVLQKQPDAPGLDEALVTLLLANSGRADLVTAYARNAGESRAPEFLALLRSLQPSAADEASRSAFDDGIRRLEKAPEIAALAPKITAATEQISAWWKQYGDPKLSPAERRALGVQIASALRDLQGLRR